MKPCNQCGKCCIKYSDGGLSATKEESELWETFRPDISEYVRKGEIWFDPKTSKALVLCPWLRKEPNSHKYTCDIYHDRPEDCRHYPTHINEMVRDECEMIEPRDLANPQQAQKRLDVLMLDSRGAYKK